MREEDASARDGKPAGVLADATALRSMSCERSRARALVVLAAALAAACGGAPVPVVSGGVLDSSDAAPVYHTLSGYSDRWRTQVEDGVELARAFWGSFGPVHVWIAGRDVDEEVPEAAAVAFLDEYCRWRARGAQGDRAGLRARANERLLDVVARGEAQAYLSLVDDFEQPAAELVFLNVHRWFFARDPIPDPTLRGVHEYTHVFQQAFADTPTWMTEGCAVFAEAWLPWAAGSCDQEVMQRRLLVSAQQARRPAEQGLSIAEMEDIDRASAPARGFYRELAYDAGAWAIVALVHRSPARSVAGLRDEFFPLARAVGWEQALCGYLGLERKDAFYREVDALLRAPVERQRAVLGALRP
ncbi:MAG: hypothetical protein ACON4Z_10980 [Planctomycetota bacterium]